MIIGDEYRNDDKHREAMVQAVSDALEDTLKVLEIPGLVGPFQTQAEVEKMILATFINNYTIQMYAQPSQLTNPIVHKLGRIP